jgi:hypothetical protein
MRKSLIITVVIALLCLCGCEAVVTVPESPEPTKASEMLLTTTAAEESTDKLEATPTSSVEIDVPEKNEEESGTPTEDVVSVDNEAGPAENNDPVSSESTVPSFEEVKADKPSEQTETQLPAPSEPPRETEQSKPTEQPVATEPTKHRQKFRHLRSRLRQPSRRSPLRQNLRWRHSQRPHTITSSISMRSVLTASPSVRVWATR